MRDKLKVINQYLRKKLAPEVVAVAKETVTEEVPDQIMPEPDGMAPTLSEEKTTSISLPSAGEPQEKKAPERLGVGLDLGTAYLVASREVEGSRVFVKTERNAFLSVRADNATKELLEKLRIKYASLGNNMFVLGNLALNLANIFNREVQRSMSVGILNPSESESIPIIKLIVQNILWPARREGEICCFSIPANPIDRNQDTIYHRGVFEGILRTLGFHPIVIDEGYAVVLSELEYKDFTGIGVSCGGGMVNVCAAYRSVPVLSFSITRGGDWIDKSAATVLNIPVSQATTIKEQGMNLKSPKSREEEAIAIYYRNYIRYFLESMAQVFGNSKEPLQFRDPIDIVFAGGSSLVGNFLDVVKEELINVRLGFRVGEIKKSDEPFTSVTRGCLFHAINTEETNSYR
ncbi:MAG: cell division FtsA domain-containing protein [Candidatus Omnitrophica bacterium]|nr:cell division FtsA domain-containing protein [Candidatus Omnitrophota bacterium]